MNKDFLTNCADSFLHLFKADDVLKFYHWEEWDSDKLAVMPRGYINMTAESALTIGSGPWMVKPEVVLLGKPKQQKLWVVMNSLQNILMDPALPQKLTNQFVQFYSEPEAMTIEQTIEGDLRVRRIVFSIAAMPLV